MVVVTGLPWLLGTGVGSSELRTWATLLMVPLGAVTCTWDDCQVPKGYVGLEAEGFRVEHTPEGWLAKAWHDDILVDLIWAPMGFEVTEEVLLSARPVNVDGVPVRALAPTDVLTSKLLALNEAHLDFEGLLAIVRGVREQVDWDELRRRTSDQPLARSFLYMADELGLTPEAAPAPLARGA